MREHLRTWKICGEALNRTNCHSNVRVVRFSAFRISSKKQNSRCGAKRKAALPMLFILRYFFYFPFLFLLPIFLFTSHFFSSPGLLPTPTFGESGKSTLSARRAPTMGNTQRWATLNDKQHLTMGNTGRWATHLTMWATLDDGQHLTMGST